MRYYEFSSTNIFEQQTFDFDGLKSQLLQWIKDAQTGKVNLDPTYNPFYSLVTNSDASGKVDAPAKIGLSPEFVKQWNTYMSSSPFISDSGPWSQFNIGDRYAKKSGEDRTYNFYITVARDKDNVVNFFRNWNKLAAKLKPISDKYQTPIKYKTHRHLGNFLTHNDSFKVYYYDIDVKDQVVAAVKEWLQDSQIQTTARSHEHGVDSKSGGGSFGQIVAVTVAKQIAELIKNHPQTSPEQWVEWMKKYVPGMIQKVQPKMVNVN
jgi:hypothetical protein